MRARSLIVVLNCLLCAAGCGEKSALGPTVPLNRQFALAPGESAAVEGTSLRLQFVRVSADSRCPADAVCIHQGDAVVHLRAADGRLANYELHTSDRSRSAVVHAGFRVELERLEPYPFSRRPIQPADYRALLIVTR
jgi:hypothetical protein